MSTGTPAPLAADPWSVDGVSLASRFLLGTAG